jgi:dihydrodipicolinate synthase/N-acetylneuraminate lyase
VLRKGDFPAGAKAALSLQGIAGRDLAAPRDGLGEEELRVLERQLIALGVPGLVRAQGAA